MSEVNTTDQPSLPHEVDPREFDGADFQRDPFPLYKQLRDHHPIFHDRFHNRWVITRYQDIDAAFQDNESFDRAVYKPDGAYKFGSSHIFGPNLLEYGNSSQHRWLRNVVAGQFVGQGLNDYDTIFTILSDAGYDGWVSIEDGMNGMEEMRESALFLHKMRDKYFA